LLSGLTGLVWDKKEATEKQIRDYVKYLKPISQENNKRKAAYVEEFQEELEVVGIYETNNCQGMERQ